MGAKTIYKGMFLKNVLSIKFIKCLMINVSKTLQIPLLLLTAIFV